MAIVDELLIAYQTTKTLATILDGLGRQLPIDSATTLEVRAAVYLISAILAPRITTGADIAVIGQEFVNGAKLIGGAAAPTDAAPAFYNVAAAAAVAAPTFSSPALTNAAAFGRALAGCTEAAFLGQAFVAEAKSDFSDRQAAVAARQRVADAMDGATDRIAAATGMTVIGILNQVALTVTDHIATVAANLRPVIQGQTPRSAPSSAIAFELYGDPSRAQELVLRNRCATPLFMPTKFEALAPAP